MPLRRFIDTLPLVFHSFWPRTQFKNDRMAIKLKLKVPFVRSEQDNNSDFSLQTSTESCGFSTRKEMLTSLACGGGLNSQFNRRFTLYD